MSTALIPRPPTEVTRVPVPEVPAAPVTYLRLRNPWRLPLRVSAGLMVLAVAAFLAVTSIVPDQTGRAAALLMGGAGFLVCMLCAHNQYAHRPPQSAVFEPMDGPR